MIACAQKQIMQDLNKEPVIYFLTNWPGLDIFT